MRKERHVIVETGIHFRAASQNFCEFAPLELTLVNGQFYKPERHDVAVKIQLVFVEHLKELGFCLSIWWIIVPIIAPQCSSQT
jgi:hypothetical protein